MLFFMLKKHPEIKRAVINDINPHLIMAYRTIKDQPKELIERLSALEKQYYAQEEEERHHAAECREQKDQLGVQLGEVNGQEKVDEERYDDH